MPPNHEDVTIGVLSRLTNALNLAARAHAIKAGMPIYLTEYGVQSKPNRFGVSLAEAGRIRRDLRTRSPTANPRVAAFSQYLLRDDPRRRRDGREIARPAWSTSNGGQPKPLYYGLPVPLTVTGQAAAARCGDSCAWRPARRR